MGIDVLVSALSTRYSRSIACAEGSSFPAGRFLMTRVRLLKFKKKVGFD